MPLQEALDSLSDTFLLKSFNKDITHQQSLLSSGELLSTTLSYSRFFPAKLIQLVKVGEESHQLTRLLALYSEEERKNRETQLKRWTSLLEPVLLLSVGLVVGIVLLAMYLPIFQMSNQF